MFLVTDSVIPGWSEGPDPESRDSGFDAPHRPGMTVSNFLCDVRSSNFSARHSDGLPGDRAGALAAQPQHGIGDFRGGHEAALRIVPGELGDGLVMAAAGLLHDVVDAAG